MPKIVVEDSHEHILARRDNLLQSLEQGFCLVTETDTDIKFITVFIYLQWTNGNLY